MHRLSVAVSRESADAGGSRPASVPFDATYPVGQVIPDGGFSGLSDTRVLPASSAGIQSVSVTLSLIAIGDGGFTGDFDTTLFHNHGGYVVLLNRPGGQSGSVLPRGSL